MTTAIVCLMVGIIIGVCVGNSNIRSKILAQINKASAPKKPVKGNKKGVK
jgi:F0F1-type ATP synthase assembly protein I